MSLEASAIGGDQSVEELKRELAEAHRREAATAEILKVISCSPTDLQPVFDGILKSAIELCEAHLGLLNLYDREKLRTVAQRGGNPGFAKWVFDRGPFLPDGEVMLRALAEGRPIQTPDMKQITGGPNSTKFAELGGVRTFLSVPLLKNGKAIGNIGIYRPEVRPFTEQQINLVNTFADQAVIAIENTRLFEAEQASKRELQESLEYQTATSDVLNVISRSTTDVQPVFDAIVKSAAKLFDPCIVDLCSLEDAQLVYRATASVRYEAKIETAKSFFPIPFDPERNFASRAILEQRIVEILDAAAPDMPEFTRKTQQAIGTFRSLTLVPLIREGQGIGVISLAHPEPGFNLSDKQLALAQTFADQAVIAIENTRLFEAEQTRTAELQARTRE